MGYLQGSGCVTDRFMLFQGFYDYLLLQVRHTLFERKMIGIQVRRSVQGMVPHLVTEKYAIAVNGITLT